jgi:NACHT domain
MGIAMTSGTSVQADPYVGPRPFGRADRHLFFGREREAHEISSLVAANKFFMLYAASGAGKTSLVHAGVLPLIADELEVLPTARFQASYPGIMADAANAYTHAVLSNWVEPKALALMAGKTLSEYLAERPRRTGPDDLPMSRLLVFDQFEELFTTQPQRWQDRRTFLEQLAEASRSHADLRILVVIREDFLSHLLDYADAFYGGMKDRYFLEPLRRPAAELAIESPAMITGRSFEPDAVDALVRQLMANRVNLGDSRIVHIQGEFVEPLLLQVACRALWTALPPTASRITLAQVSQLADVDTALARFYSDAVRQAARSGKATEQQIREWTQRNLITPEGTRGTVHVGASTTAGLPNDVALSLDGKFLRAEFRAGARWLEITHDSLLAPIEQSNREYFSSRDKSSLSQAADRLAEAVEAQWRTEAQSRRLNDPYPLPVSWRAADPALADPWEALTRLATSGAGWRSSRSSGLWATGPGDLGGRDNDLVHLVDRVPTRRLVVLGGPGSGKTVLMIRLLLDLLSVRAPDDPVPVLLPAAGWDPLHRSLYAWLSVNLSALYPALSAPAEPRAGARTLGEVLLETGRILPILDGLDEIPPDLIGPAIRRINEASRPGDPLVVACRTRQYAELVYGSGDGPSGGVRAAAVIELRPLSPAQVADYLRDSGAARAGANRWDPVLETLGTQAPVAQALTTPLMVGLASAVYNHPPGGRLLGSRDPAELRSPAFRDRAAVESFLFDAFIPAAYSTDSHSAWDARHAQRWLTFLATDLENTIGGPDLAWWQLARAVPGRVAGLAAGVVLGLMLGAAGGLALGLQWLAYGLAVGLLPGLAIGFGLSRDQLPSYGVSWRPSRALSIGVALGTTALVSGTAIGGFKTGLLAAPLFALFPGLAAGLQGRRRDLGRAPSPAATLARDGRTAFTIGLVTAVAVGLPVGVMIGIGRGVWHGISLGPSLGITLGIVSGVAAGLAAVSNESAWLRWQLARCWLAATRRLPWRLTAFLEDAASRGVLRRSGAVYQFRHVALQRRLASLTPPPSASHSLRSNDR